MRRLAPLIAALAAITVIVALAFVLRGGESGDEPGASGSAPSTVATPTGAPTSATVQPSPTGPVVAFLGSYVWQEQPGGDTNTGRRHTLYLTQASTDGRAAIGSLVTEGPGVGEIWPVTAQVTSDGVEVSYSDRQTGGGKPSSTVYAVDDVLFTLLGPADAPRTRLGALTTENRHAAEGDYFFRWDGQVDNSPSLTGQPAAGTPS